MSTAEGTDLLDLTRSVAEELTGTAHAAPLAVGTRFGRYRILRRLGSGGMGVVYLAEQMEPMRRHVAIKVVRASRADSGSDARMQVERQALARLSHPGIAQIFDAGVGADGLAYFAMEYVEGQQLDQWWALSAATLSERIELLHQLCLAVGHAHLRGILHCDLKPANVLVHQLDGQPRLKVIDFGIARASGDADIGFRGGTPGYVSPEQAAGAELDAGSDVYALGALLLELLGGQPLRPWTRSSSLSAREQFARIAAAPEQPDVTAALAALPLSAARRHELAAIIEQALAVSPQARYADAAALGQDLKRWLDQHPVQALPPHWLYRLRCSMRRQRWAWAASVAFLSLLGLFGWQLTLQYQERVRERDTAEQMIALLLETFDAADPIAHPEGSASVRELLSGAVAALANRELAPAVRTRVLQALGQTQLNLELYDDARASLSAALAALPTGATAQAAELRLLLAQVDSDAGAFDAAEAALAALAADYSTLSPALVIDIALLRANNHWLRDDLDAAEHDMRIAQEHAAHATPAQRVKAALMKARIDRSRGHKQTVTETLQQALVEARQLWGERDQRTLTVLNDLAVHLADIGAVGAAAPLLDQVLAHSETALGKDSSEVATVIANLGVSSLRLGDPVRAEALHRRALAIFESRLGSSSMHTGTEYSNLASAIEAQGRHGEAAVLYQNALQSLQAALGPEHMRVGVVLHNQARNHIALGQLELARAELQRSGDILRPALGETHPRWRVWQTTAAALQLASGQTRAAADALAVLAPRLSEDFGADSREASRAWQLWAQALDDEGDCAAHAELRQQRVDIGPGQRCGDGIGVEG